MCGDEYKCDHFSIRDGTWNGAIPNLPRPLAGGWNSAVIGILDTVCSLKDTVYIDESIHVGTEPAKKL